MLSKNILDNTRVRDNKTEPFCLHIYFFILVLLTRSINRSPQSGLQRQARKDQRRLLVPATEVRYPVTGDPLITCQIMQNTA